MAWVVALLWALSGAGLLGLELELRREGGELGVEGGRVGALGFGHEPAFASRASRAVMRWRRSSEEVGMASDVCFVEVQGFTTLLRGNWRRGGGVVCVQRGHSTRRAGPFAYERRHLARRGRGFSRAKGGVWRSGRGLSHAKGAAERSRRGLSHAERRCSAQPEGVFARRGSRSEYRARPAGCGTAGRAEGTRAAGVRKGVLRGEVDAVGTARCQVKGGRGGGAWGRWVGFLPEPPPPLDTTAHAG